MLATNRQMKVDFHSWSDDGVVVGLMFEHSLFNKIKNRDPTAMPCWKSLRMATVEGAEAIGIVLTTHANLFNLVNDCCIVRIMM